MIIGIYENKRFGKCFLPLIHVLSLFVYYSYTNGTWEVKCSGPAGGVCTGVSTQAFYVTSSVKFTQIPPQTPEPVSKYVPITLTHSLYHYTYHGIFSFINCGHFTGDRITFEIIPFFGTCLEILLPIFELPFVVSTLFSIQKTKKPPSQIVNK